MVTSIDSNLLLSYYNARAGIGGGTGGASGSSAATAKVAPTAPWTKDATPAQTTAAVKSALAGQKLINEGAAQLDLPGASEDYRKLFALYQGLATMGDLAAQSQKKGLSTIEQKQLQDTFAKGLAEVQGYVSSADLTKVRLTTGDVASTVKTTAPVAAAKTEYVTAPLYSGTAADAVPAFQGNVQFSIDVKRSGVVHSVGIDLSEMGTQTRSIANVVNFINGKLTAEGLDTRFATQRLPGLERTTKVGTKTVSLGFGPDQFAFKVRPNGETVSFSATATAGAVYMAQGAGDPNPDGKVDTNDGVIKQQLLKFQTDTTAVDAPVQGQNEANWVDGRAFARTLGPEVKTVRATKVGPDGSVYMLADVTAKTAGQDILGAQDVALIKYDAAGNQVFSRTLGASDSATGLALAVSADGKVAIAGSVSGGLNGATEGALNSGEVGVYAGQSDSFVTTFNADGEEIYTQRRGARQADEASQLTFGADGSVYVAGRSKSALPGASGLGGWDSYIEAFAPPDSKGKVATTFTQNFGTSADDRPAGVVVDGTSLVTASVENGRGVLRRFDISSGTPALTATRDLGDLQGGDITGLGLDGGQVVVAGSTANAALDAGTVTRANSGGVDAFAARLSADLVASGADAVAYYGGTGNDRATALSVQNGQVWIAGSAGTDLPGQPAVGKKDGFLAKLDIAGGNIDWSRRFTGKDGFAAPNSIAVDTSGASALDKLGLPKGTIDLTDSPQITAATSLRAGEQFTVRIGTGHAQTITLDAAETLDTLAQKIRRATGFQAKVTIGSADGSRKLTVVPQNSRTIVEFGAGKTDKNALALLGIPEGVVRSTVVTSNGTTPADGRAQIYGLSLPSNLNLDDATATSHAAAEVSAAMGVIRKAYKDLVAAASPQSAQVAAAKAKSGPVPAYLTNQIANYQAALDRLGGGG
ncbi:hypothetical protein [Phenylobacterium sp.]|uniref:hypothetical protein n=1 Tax=Phenylobacterium sp. TaxID=1871053 RepID=UPI0025E65F88|nr:hypothetical protein [Phenylobacterium sp.]